MALPGLSQTELPKYHPIAIGLTVSGQFNYTTVNGGAHIAAGMSFKPLFVTGFSLSIKGSYASRISLSVFQEDRVTSPQLVFCPDNTHGAD